jgi:hypothetical protein
MRSDAPKIPQLVLPNGSTTVSNVQKANVLATAFHSVFTVEHDPGPLPVRHQYNEMQDVVFTEPGIKKLLTELKEKKASGPDGIPTIMLKIFAKWIAPIFCYLFQKSYDSSEIPDDWRHALVHPIYKSGSKTDPLNYRPISLTSVACKMFEHVLASGINCFLDNHDLTFSRQHGFRQRYSCETALSSVVYEIGNSLDDGQEVDALFLDFRKAFDTVPHRRLHTKLIQMGLSVKTISWIDAFLRDRTFSVRAMGAVSSVYPVVSGVPQGSVLGPILFKIYINDAPVVSKSPISIFADDILLMREISCSADTRQLQLDLLALESWSRTWKLKLNPAKCQHIRFTRLTTRTAQQTTYVMRSGEPIQKTSSVKYLGVIFQPKLQWKDHIQMITSKTNSVIGLMRRNFLNAPVKAKLLLYKSLVLSVVEYGAVALNHRYQNAIGKIERIQSRACRFILNDYVFKSSVTAMRKTIDLPVLSERRTQYMSNFIKHLLSGKKVVPGFSIRIHPISGERMLVPPFCAPRRRGRRKDYSSPLLNAIATLWPALVS